MDFQKAEPRSDDLETCVNHASAGVAAVAAKGLPVGVSEALADPIIKALMAADGVDPKGLEELLQRTASRLAQEQIDSSSRARQCQRLVRPAEGIALFAKSSVLALAVIAGLSVAPRSAAADDTPVTFIRALGDQAVSVIGRPDTPLATKAAYFVAIDGISMAVAQRSEIVALIAREGGQVGVLLATMRQ